MSTSIGVTYGQTYGLRILDSRRFNLASAKEEVRRLLESLPDDASFEDVQYSIYVRERVDRARTEANEGKLIEQDEVENRMRRWLNE